MKIKEAIIVEGRDDTIAVNNSVDALTIETHGYGIRKETWKLIETAYNTTGIIVFTDPDHAGEQIRKRITDRFPDAGEAYLDVSLAKKKEDIGIENASPASIREALLKAHARQTGSIAEEIKAEDMIQWGLMGGEESSARRQAVGSLLGIGFANGKTMLKRLNRFGINRDTVEAALEKMQKG